MLEGFFLKVAFCIHNLGGQCILASIDDFAIDHWLTSKNFLYDLQKEATRYETCERVKILMKTGTC